MQSYLQVLENVFDNLRADETESGASRAVCAHLRSDLRRLLGIHHADVLEVFEGVLPVLLLGTHVLLQQAEDVTGLRGRGGDGERKKGKGGFDEFCSFTFWQPGTHFENTFVYQAGAVINYTLILIQIPKPANYIVFLQSSMVCQKIRLI